MSTTIRLKSSGSTGNIPSNSELEFGEVALNYADGVLYFKNASNVVTQISGSEANTFETINANGTLIIADSNVDILTLSSGDGIHIAGNASSDSLTVAVRFDDTITSTSTNTAATANSVKTAYDWADDAHEEATAALAEAEDAANTVQVLKNSSLVLSRANLNFKDTGTVNVAATSGTGQVNLEFTVNTTGSGIVTAQSTAEAAYAKANAPITIKEVYASNNGVVNTFANISTIQFDADSGMAVVDEGNNAVTIQLNSTFKTWNINGSPGLVAFGLDTVNFLSANGITLSANNLSSPKTFTIDATELPNAYAQANAAYGAANNRVLKSGDTMTGQLNISSGGLLVTGDANVSGDVVAQTNLKSLYSVGDEGGEIFLANAATNTNVASGITIDVFQNKLRFFENGGTNRGAYIDISATPGSVGRDLLAGGPQGSQGYQGFQGATGPQGFQGETGPQGPQGAQGVQGHQGFQGDTGPQGPQGVQGAVGAQGHQGVQGEIGAQGVQGSQGVQGATGPQGSQGAQGEIGAQGYQGFQGETGPQGVQGVQGHQGYQGIQGATGPQGFQGVLGAQGHQGVQGSQGVQGETGSFGGATFEYVFNTNTANTDPTAGFVKFNNTTLLSATEMYIDNIDRLSSNVFNYLNTIDDSTSTIKGTFKIANSANVLEYAFFNINGSHLHVTDWFVVPVAGLNTTLVGSNFPNSTNVIMTFVRTGDKGDTGAQGPQGIQGATGSQGFQGVDGAQGAIGAQGVQGHQGFQGATGPQGSQGLEGAQGPTGVQGAQGATGPQGAQGVAGAQGATGPQGAQGAQGAPGVNPGGTTNFVAKFTGATTIADSTIFDDGTIVKINSVMGLTNTASPDVVSTSKGTTFVTSSTSQVSVDSFAAASFRSAKYFVQMTSGSAYHVIELNLVHDGSTVYLTQYGENKTGASLGTFDSDINTGNVRLLCTPTNATTTVKLHRITIAV
jgi:hypothetical protein